MMTIRNEALENKLQALNALLEDARPHDDNWSGEFLDTLEVVYRLALHQDTPVVAASRTKLAIAA